MTKTFFKHADMIKRPILGIALGAMLLMGPQAADSGEMKVFLRGYEVTRRHIVFGTVIRASGARAVINLGYAHGVEKGHTFLVVRTVNEKVIPISGLTVIRTQPEGSTVRVEGPFQVQEGDYVLIRARHLDLWNGRTRMDHLIRRRYVVSRKSYGYQTVSPDPNLLNEVARDDEFQKRQYIFDDADRFVAQARRHEKFNDAPAGAITRTPVLSEKDLEKEKEEVSSEPTLAEWLSLFITAAQTEETIVSRLEDGRLFHLKLLDKTQTLTEQNAPLYRRLLIRWMNQVLYGRS